MYRKDRKKIVSHTVIGFGLILLIEVRKGLLYLNNKVRGDSAAIEAIMVLAVILMLLVPMSLSLRKELQEVRSKEQD